MPVHDYLFRGILIGLLFGIPAGAVGAMTIQRTFAGGVRAGLLTGLGSSAADCLYAAVSVFGLTVISDFLLRHQTIINFLGGTLLLAMGVRLFFRKNETVQETKPVSGGIRLFLSSFAVGVTNPAAVLTFLFAFSYFGITGNVGTIQGILLVTGVFTGTYIWWGALSGFVSFVRKKTGNCGFRYMNRIFGSLISLFGAAVFIHMTAGA